MDFQLLVDLHKRASRQGPGGDIETERALALSLVDKSTPLRIADIGCGTGASTLVLARQLNAEIIAVDFIDDFLEVLENRAAAAGVSEKIFPLSRSMDNLPFEDKSLDMIWSEGAIYNIGFENGIKAWRHYLKPGGVLVVSEITWITDTRPEEIQKYWETEYPEIDVASSKISVLEKHGFSPIGYFILPEKCWIENYYGPLQESFDAFLDRNGNREEAQAVVEAERKEIELYKKHKAYYSYGVYIARKLS